MLCKYQLKEQHKQSFANSGFSTEKGIFKTCVYLREGTVLLEWWKEYKLEMAFSERKLVDLTKIKYPMA